MYAKRLGAESSRLKIEELLRSLLQGIGEGGSMLEPKTATGLQGVNGELCGWRKDLLLREVVLLLGKSPHPTSTSSDNSRQVSRLATNYCTICSTSRNHK